MSLSESGGYPRMVVSFMMVYQVDCQISCTVFRQPHVGKSPFSIVELHGLCSYVKMPEGNHSKRKARKMWILGSCFQICLGKKMAAIVGLCVNDILVMRLKYLSIPASAIHVGWYTSSGPPTWRGKSSVGRIREDTYLPSIFFGMA